jgi:hypothetical protein
MSEERRGEGVWTPDKQWHSVCITYYSIHFDAKSTRVAAPARHAAWQRGARGLAHAACMRSAASLVPRVAPAAASAAAASVCGSSTACPRKRKADSSCDAATCMRCSISACSGRRSRPFGCMGWRPRCCQATARPTVGLAVGSIKWLSSGCAFCWLACRSRSPQPRLRRVVLPPLALPPSPSLPSPSRTEPPPSLAPLRQPRSRPRRGARSASSPGAPATRSALRRK